MARIARVVVPGVAHHVTQRGICRQRTFFRDFDDEDDPPRMAEQCVRRGIDIGGYCLLPNRVPPTARRESASTAGGGRATSLLRGHASPRAACPCRARKTSISPLIPVPFRD